MRYDVKIPATADGSLAVKIGNWLREAGDEVKIGQVVRAMKNQTNIPGVKVWDEMSIRTRGVK